VVTIAALVCDRAARARLRGAVRDQAGLAFCETVSELIAAVADGAAAAVVTEWRDATGETVDKAIRALRAEYPSIPVLIYAPLTPQGARDMLDATRAGAAEVVIANFDDMGVTLGQRLAMAQSSALAARVTARLAGLMPDVVIQMLDYFFRQARHAPSVAGAAIALGVHRKTLALRCARAGLPSPSALGCWARLILTAQRLEDPGRTTERSALDLGYPSGSAFRNMLKRYTGLSPSEVRERGGSICVAEQFIAHITAARQRARRPWPGSTAFRDAEARESGTA
jgi:AraC-like DNA-binding protein